MVQPWFNRGSTMVNHICNKDIITDTTTP